jgi:hypothetical protein
MADLGDVVRVTAKMSWASGASQIQNVYHIKVLTGGNTDALVHSEIADALDDAYTELLGSIPDVIDFDTIETFNITQDAPMVEDAWPTLTEGAVSGESLPAQCAPLVLFNTATARSQGRKFLPFVLESGQSGGSLSAGVLEDMANYAAALIGDIVGTSWSGKFGNYNDDLVRFAPWVSALVKDIVRTQRRRVFGVGS